MLLEVMTSDAHGFGKAAPVASPARMLTVGEGPLAGVHRALAELEADAEELVVLGDAVRARQAARLDLPRVGRDREVGDERVLGLARAVADDASGSPLLVAMRMASSVSVSVPIWFSLMRIAFATPPSMPRCEALDVRDEEVVADELQLARRAAAVSAFQPSQSSSEKPSSIETIGYLRDERLVDGDELGRR